MTIPYHAISYPYDQTPDPWPCSQIIPGLLMKVVSCFLYLGVLNSAGKLLIEYEPLLLINATTTLASSVATARRNYLFDNKPWGTA